MGVNWVCEHYSPDRELKICENCFKGYKSKIQALQALIDEADRVFGIIENSKPFMGDPTDTIIDLKEIAQNFRVKIHEARRGI